MRRRVMWAFVVLSIVAGVIVVLSPAAPATKILESYKSNTKELKSECAEGGGTYFGSSSGRVGLCAWDDGTISTCNNSRKGKNCNTQGRVVTDDGDFLDFVVVAVTDPPTVKVVTPDDTGASGSEQPASSQKLIRRLLAKEDFTMTVNDLATTCTNVIEADLIMRNDGSIAVCIGDSSVIFCDTESARKNCTIEAPKKKAVRTALQLLRRALVDPSSVTITVAPSPGTTPTTARRSTSSTTEPPATTTPSTSASTTTPTTGPAFL